MVEGWQQWVASGAAWLLTYLIHSTLLIALVWLISRRLDGRPAALDALWKTALVGGLVTATLQTAAGVSPVGGRLDLAAASMARPEIETSQKSSLEPVEAPAPLLAELSDSPADSPADVTSGSPSDSPDGVASDSPDSPPAASPGSADSPEPPEAIDVGEADEPPASIAGSIIGSGDGVRGNGLGFGFGNGLGFGFGNGFGNGLGFGLGFWCCLGSGGPRGIRKRAGRGHLARSCRARLGRGRRLPLLRSPAQLVATAPPAR